MSSEPARRIDQILSSHGYCTRSEAKGWVARGRITVDGKPATSAEAKAPVGQLRVDGEPVEFPGGLLVLMHKPVGCVCSHNEKDGPRVYERLPARWSRRNPPVTSVGRLDRDTTGVLLITDQGALVQRWTSPRHKVTKLYEVTVDTDLRPELIDLFAAGTLILEGEKDPCLPATLTILGPRDATLELIEGRYHQVKRMFASQGCAVTRLHRSRFGNLTLDGLKPGQWRELQPHDVVPGSPLSEA